MNKISVFILCLFAITLVSCNGSNANKPEEEKESTKTITGNTSLSEESNGNDFLKNYEDFVNQEVAKLEKSPNAETITESKIVAEAFVSKYGDLNAIEATPEVQEKLNELRDKYNAALEKASNPK